jgi:hypothetical protein
MAAALFYDGTESLAPAAATGAHCKLLHGQGHSRQAGMTQERDLSRLLLLSCLCGPWCIPISQSGMMHVPCVIDVVPSSQESIQNSAL